MPLTYTFAEGETVEQTNAPETTPGIDLTTNEDVQSPETVAATQTDISIDALISLQSIDMQMQVANDYLNFISCALVAAVIFIILAVFAVRWIV